MLDRLKNKIRRRLAARETKKRQRKVNEQWRNMNAADQIVTFAAILKASPELRSLFREALNVKGREELSAPGVRKRPELWTPGR